MSAENGTPMKPYADAQEPAKKKKKDSKSYVNPVLAWSLIILELVVIGLIAYLIVKTTM